MCLQRLGRMVGWWGRDGEWRRAEYFFRLAQLNEDEGKYRVKAWKVSSWKARS